MLSCTKHGGHVSFLNLQLRQQLLCWAASSKHKAWCPVGLLRCADHPMYLCHSFATALLCFFLWVVAEVQVPLDGCRRHLCRRSRKAEVVALAADGGAHGEA
jgi:hypothetical protein